MNIRSPLNYMGNKYGLLNWLKANFPSNNECKIFIDLFGGSGTISVNVDYEKIIYNELNKSVYDLVKMFFLNDSKKIINRINKNIEHYGLAKKQTDKRKTTEEENNYYNERYKDFVKAYNNSERNVIDLFTLSFYSFSHQIRVNSKQEFNMPKGNGCFTKENKNDIELFCSCISKKNINFYNKDAFEILRSITEKNNEIFIYLDPPYFNTTATYNEGRGISGWTIDKDIKLFEELDRINKLGIKWALSNVSISRGKENTHLISWAKKGNYKIIELDREYCCFGKGSANNQEILIINYEPKFEKIRLF